MLILVFSKQAVKMCSLFSPSAFSEYSHPILFLTPAPARGISFARDGILYIPQMNFLSGDSATEWVVPSGVWGLSRIHGKMECRYVVG